MLNRHSVLAGKSPFSSRRSNTSNPVLEIPVRQSASATILIFVVLVSLTVSFLPVNALGQGGTWVTKTPMPTARIGSVSGVINGLVYVVNGDTPNSGSVGTNEVYDPATDTWATKSPNPTPSPFAAAGVITGKLYVVGGCGPASDCRIDTINTLEIYDSATDSWTQGAPDPTARSSATAGVINGKLYVAGGQLACPPCVQVPTLEVYDPVSDSWATKSPMPLAVGNGPGSAVVNGQLFVVGGLTNSFTPTGAVQVYDPATDTWILRASTMPTPRTFVNVGLINGILYAVGGGDATGSHVATNESYNPATDTWGTSTPELTGRTWATGSVANNAFYVVGGLDQNNSYLATNEVFSSQLTCTPPPSGMTNWWPGDGNYNDLIGGDSGTPVGSVLFQPGEVGEAFSFNGAVGNYVDIGNPSNLQITGPITVDAWINPNAVGTYEAIFNQMSTANRLGEVQLRIGNTGTIDWFRRNTGSVSTQGVTSDIVVVPGTWQHIAAVYDGSAYYVYINGVLHTTVCPYCFAYGAGQGPDIKIGAADSGAYPFNGLIDEVEVFNRALSASEIQAIYAAGSAGKCKGCIASLTPTSQSFGTSGGLWIIRCQYWLIM